MAFEIKMEEFKRTLRFRQNWQFRAQRRVQKYCCMPSWGKRRQFILWWYSIGWESRPRRSGCYSAIAVRHYAKYTEGSISPLIVRFVLRDNITERTKHWYMKGRVWLVNLKEYCRQWENKGSERLRQTQQTGTLPGLFQPNVFKYILLITKL